jgi:hypothetical protein
MKLGHHQCRSCLAGRLPPVRDAIEYRLNVEYFEDRDDEEMPDNFDRSFPLTLRLLGFNEFVGWVEE